MEKETRDFYLRRIKYLESEIEKLEYRNKDYEDIIADLDDNIEIAVKFIRERIIELLNSKNDSDLIRKQLVINMFKALKKILFECDSDE